MVYLDNLKIVLTAGVTAAHAAMTYGAVGTWVYEESSLSDVAAGILGALVGVGAMFGLGLFSVMAGLLTTGPLSDAVLAAIWCRACGGWGCRWSPTP